MSQLTRFSLALLLSAGLVSVSACGAAPEVEPGAEDDLSDIEQAPLDELTLSAMATVNTTLYYEGSCAFLRRCSSGAGAMGKTYCNGYYTCSDTAAWVARPTSVSISKCGGTARICRGTRCVSAAIRDTSCCGHWEGNPAVFRALGLGYGDGSGCAGYGQASVSISY